MRKRKAAATLYGVKTYTKGPRKLLSFLFWDSSKIVGPELGWHGLGRWRTRLNEAHSCAGEPTAHYLGGLLLFLSLQFMPSKPSGHGQVRKEREKNDSCVTAPLAVFVWMFGLRVCDGSSIQLFVFHRALSLFESALSPLFRAKSGQQDPKGRQETHTHSAPTGR
ncbi:hypothetical protein Ddc_06967 [Ditylenchus destructor]|nr:hypothetical protein Ddc_06967 [Ditylenchus destructor]